MKAAVVHESFVVALDHDEACRLMRGETIGDRINPIVTDAKVIVRPMQDLDPAHEPIEDFMGEGYWDRLNAMRSIVHILGDQDVIIYVPPDVPKNALIASETIERADVVPMATDYPDALRDSLPENGVTIRFDRGAGDYEFWDLVNPPDKK